jgi:hypothetical protein
MKHRNLPFFFPLCLLLTSTIQGQDKPQPVIDMHMHAHMTISRDKRHCFPKPCESPPSKITDPEALRPAALAEMEKYNVVLAVVSGDRDDVLKWTADESGKFVTGQLFYRPDDLAFSELKALIETGQIQVLGELAFQYEGIPIDDPSVDPLLSLAHEYDVPVHVHVAGLGGTSDFPIIWETRCDLRKCCESIPAFEFTWKMLAGHFLRRLLR